MLSILLHILSHHHAVPSAPTLGELSTAYNAVTEDFSNIIATWDQVVCQPIMLCIQFNAVAPWWITVVETRPVFTTVVTCIIWINYGTLFHSSLIQVIYPTSAILMTT